MKKTLIRAFAMVMCLVLMLGVLPAPAYAATVTIGHARSSEGNTDPGDKNGNEVKTCNWYYKDSKPWTAVIRPNNPSHANKIAKTMEKACANKNIGYSQDRRTTLYSKAEDVNWNLSKINTKCDADCSSLVAVCVNAAGISVSRNMTTATELKTLKNTGKFTVYTSSDYTESSSKLKRGDILLAKGHTAVVLSNGTDISDDGNNNSDKNRTKRGVKINMTRVPSSIKKGNSFTIDGTISSGNKITKVTGSIINSSGKSVQYISYNPNSTSVRVKNSKLDNNLRFGSLAKGTYTLKIVAKDSSGKSDTYSHKFSVGTKNRGETFPACKPGFKSFVDALNSLGIDSSKPYRKKIAYANGIEDYNFTEEQNTFLLNLLKDGDLIKP